MSPAIGSRLWEQSLLAKQAPRFLDDRIAFIAGKPCSHINSFITRQSYQQPHSALSSTSRSADG
ncbi:hypothetical protein F7R20_21785 [Pseudomonas brassicacearum subsp. brassicacearum]|nr:hypothetical protein F7R20_21785 [Pseudomonas brassicacearum subsp. brassicacearum]PJH90321.1 hypothetical protein CVG87_06550 [Pseudomonas sp. WCS365]QEO77583.1 hypothetical protein ELZ14_08465 [Pseudomonas brassicacearum]